MPRQAKAAACTPAFVWKLSGWISVILFATALITSQQVGATAFVGVVKDVQISSILSAGWTQCHVSLYSDGSKNLTTITSVACTKSRLFVGCRLANNAAIIVGAQDRRDQVLKLVGTQPNSFSEAQGVNWFRSDNAASFGFVPAGEIPERTPCPTGNTGYGRRLCWPLGPGNNLGVGGRCGAADLTGASSTHDRIVFHADDLTPVPTTQVPSTQVPSRVPTKPGDTVSPTIQPSSAPTYPGLYSFAGVTADMPISVLRGGWSQCHISRYNQSVDISKILTTCTARFLVLACRNQNSATLIASAMAERLDVVKEIGPSPNGATFVNNVNWYYSSSHSWGFAGNGVGTDRTPCSTNVAGSPLRLCWPTVFGTVISGGICGTSFGVTSSTVERIVFQADYPTFAPTQSPSTSRPSQVPSTVPSKVPSRNPSTSKPSSLPSQTPSTSKPSQIPSKVPSRNPTSSKPSFSPSLQPSATPSASPTLTALVGFPAALYPQVAVGNTGVTVEISFQSQFPVHVSIEICPEALDWLHYTTEDGLPSVVNLLAANEIGTINLTAIIVGSSKTALETPEEYPSCIILTARLPREDELLVFSQTIPVTGLAVLPCETGAVSASGTNFPQVCLPCPLGTHSQEGLPTVCSDCPVLLPRTLEPGSISVDSCIVCPLGMYCPVGSEPVSCPASGGYESSENADVLDGRNSDACEAIPCEETFWCGPGAAQDFSYIKSLSFTSLVGTTVIKQRKTLSFTVQNVRESEEIILRVSPPNSTHGPLWYSCSQEPVVVPPGAMVSIPINVDSAFFDEDKITSTIQMEWALGTAFATDPGLTMAVYVPVDINIVTIVIGPTSFDYSTTSLTSTMEFLDPPLAPVIEIFNTLCNNSVTVIISPYDCSAESLLDSSAPWFQFTDPQPFVLKNIEAQAGVSFKIPFTLNATQLDGIIPFEERNVNGTDAATIYTTCLSISSVLEGLDITLQSSIDVSFRLLRLCPPGTFSPTGRDVDGCSPCFFDSYQPAAGKSFCERCPDDFPRTLEAGSIEAKDCLVDKGGFLDLTGEKATCPVGVDCSVIGATVETLTLFEGYWRTTPNSTNVLECPIQRYCRGGKTIQTERRRILVVESNNNDSSSSGVCLPHHTGAFCYGCESGYVKRTDAKICSMCTPDDYQADASRMTGIFLSLSVLLLIFTVLVFFFTRRGYKIDKGISKRTLTEERAYDIFRALDVSILVQIVIGFVQVVSGMSVTFREVLPPFFHQLRQVFATLALDLVNVLDFGCTLAAQNHLTTLLLSTLLPIIFSVVLFLIHLFVEKTVAHGDLLFRAELRTTTFTVFLIILFLVYPSCSNKILATFSCRSFDDSSSVLTVDPSVSCLDAEYYKYKIYAVFMVLVYPIGIPVFYSVLLFKERASLNPFSKRQNLDEVAEAMREANRDVRYLKFLWKPYKARYFWFETFELLRKLAQTSIVVFIAPGSSPQIVFQLLTTVVSVVVLNSLSPYVQRKHNLLASLAQWCIFGIALSTLLIKFNRQQSDYDQGALDTFLVFLFFSVPVAACVLVLIQVFQARSVVLFCLNWDRLKEHWMCGFPKLEKFFGVIAISSASGAVADRNLMQKDNIKRKAGATEGAKAARRRTSMMILNETAAKKPDDLAEAMATIARMRTIFDTVQADLQSEIAQQTSRGDMLLQEREQATTRAEMLEQELRKNATALMAKNDAGFGEEHTNKRDGTFQVVANNTHIARVAAGHADEDQTPV